MKQGQDAKASRRRVQLEPFGNALAVGYEVHVTENDALREAGGSRGINNCRRRVRLDFRQACFSRGNVDFRKVRYVGEGLKMYGRLHLRSQIGKLSLEIGVIEDHVTAAILDDEANLRRR